MCMLMKIRELKKCFTSPFDGSKDGHLSNRLADIVAIAPEDRFELKDECLELVFESYSEESFSGFGSD